MIPYITLLAFLMLVSCSSTAQLFSSYNFRFKTYTTSDGLAHNSVKKCASDGLGFLWIATENGLSRFDGYQFKNFLHNNNDSNSLENNNLCDLAIDQQNRVYIAYKTGVSVYDPAAGRFSRISFNGNNIHAEAITYDSATAILFIFTPGGMYIYNTLTHTARQATHFQPSFKVICSNLYKDREGYVWAMFERHGYYRYSIARDTGFYFNSNSWPVNMYQDETGTYYMGTWGSGFQVFQGIANEYQKTTYEMPLSNLPGTNYIFSGIAEAPALTGNDILWVTTHVSGIGLFSKSQRKFIHHFAYTPQAKNGINSPYFWNIYNAPDGNLWICGWYGLMKVNAQNQYFQNAELPELTSSLYNCITGIIDDPFDPKVTWMAVLGNGIAKYDKTTGKISKRFFYDEETVHTNYMERWPKSFFKDSNQVIWSNTYGGFIKIKKGSVSFVPVTDSGRSAFSDFSYQDSRGNLWHMNQLLFEFNPYTGQYKRWTITAAENSLQRYYGITEDSNGLMYVVADAGVFSINITTGAIQKIDFAGSLSNKMDWNNPFAVMVIQDILYTATPKGLIAFNIKTKQSAIIGAAESLNQIIRPPFFKDRMNRLWIYCINGLYMYDPQNNYVRHFTTADGIYANSSDPAHFFEYNNNVYLGSRMAYTRFNPAFININKALPVPYITAVTVNNIPEDKPGYAAPVATFSNNQKNIVFEFTAIEYNFPDKISFSYYLEGFDKSWSTPSFNRRKGYTNLPAGKYTFFVRAFNNNNLRSTTIASFRFTITPSFWQTGWFRFIIAILVLTAFVIAYKWRIKKLHLEQEEKSKLQQVQLEQYKQQLEMEQIINFFSSSLADKNTREEVIWDVAKNLIQKLGFANCMIYLWNEDKTELLQKAGYGPNGSLENVVKEPFNSKLWQGIVGHVAATKKPIMLGDTSKDPRYRADVLTRASELCVPALYNGELVSVIDSEDFAKDYYTQQHLQILTTIATLMAARLVSIEAADEARRKKEELSKMNEQLAQLELAALRSQMNPHFIFNSLNSIHKYIWENKQEDASEYLTKFSKLIRMILENSKEKEVALSNEIELLHLYVELEHRRCNGKFMYSITVDEGIDPDNTAIPSMLVQPYAENAIWHGLMQKTGQGLLQISFHYKNNILECIVDDDGIGRKKAMEIKEAKMDKHTSLGLSITGKRVSLIYQESGRTATVEVKDKTDTNGNAQGTTVILQLPFNNFY